MHSDDNGFSEPQDRDEVSVAGPRPRHSADNGGGLGAGAGSSQGPVSAHLHERLAVIDKSLLELEAQAAAPGLGAGDRLVIITKIDGLRQHRARVVEREANEILGPSEPTKSLSLRTHRVISLDELAVGEASNGIVAGLGGLRVMGRRNGGPVLGGELSGVLIYDFDSSGLDRVHRSTDHQRRQRDPQWRQRYEQEVARLKEEHDRLRAQLGGFKSAGTVELLVLDIILAVERDKMTARQRRSLDRAVQRRHRQMADRERDFGIILLHLRGVSLRRIAARITELGVRCSKTHVARTVQKWDTYLRTYRGGILSKKNAPNLAKRVLKLEVENADLRQRVGVIEEFVGLPVGGMPAVIDEFLATIHPTSKREAAA